MPNSQRPSADAEPLCVSIPEFGRRLGRNRRTIRKLINEGLLTVVQIEGTQDRVPVSEIERFTVRARPRAGAAAAGK